MASLFGKPREEKEILETTFREFSMIDSLKELTRQADERKVNLLNEQEAKHWLKTLGLKVVEERIVNDLEEALKASEKMTYPVVLKGLVEGQIHKTDAGLVKLNLYTPDQVKSAYQEMLRLKPQPHSFLIQPMLPRDLELIVGINRDPQFGPAVMLGLGGIHAEVYKDVVFRLPPIKEKEIFEMVSELKGGALFKGYRGSKPVEMKRLADWLIRLGWFSLTYPQVKELDVNPLLIVEGEPVAVDATLVFSPKD
jgi:acetyltransferase